MIISKVLINENEIQDAVNRLANVINNDYSGKKPLLVGVLKGAFIFLSDLMRKLTIDCEVDFLSLSSYRNSSESGGSVSSR